MQPGKMKSCGSHPLGQDWRDHEEQSESEIRTHLMISILCAVQKHEAKGGGQGFRGNENEPLNSDNRTELGGGWRWTL